MTPPAVALLLGLAGAVLSAIGLAVVVARARRSSRDSADLPPGALTPPLLLGVALTLSIGTIVGAVVLR